MGEIGETEPISNEKLKEIEGFVKSFTSSFAERCRSLNNPLEEFDSQIGHSILPMLDTLSDMIKHPVFIQAENQLKSLVPMIHSSLNSILPLQMNEELMLEIFKRLIPIVSQLSQYNMEKWKYFILQIYIKGCPQLMNTSSATTMESILFFKVRFQFVLDFIAKQKNTDIISRWWEPLLWSILPPYIRYKISTPSRNTEQDYTPPVEFTNELKSYFCRFLFKENIIAGYRKYIQAIPGETFNNRQANYFNCLISFLSQSSNLSEFVDLAQFVLDEWNATLTLDRSSIIEFYKLKSKDTLQQFMFVTAKLCSHYIVKMIGSPKNYEEITYKSIFLMRDLWNSIYDKTIEHEFVTKFMQQFDQHAKTINFLIFVTLIFDLKLIDNPKIWELFPMPQHKTTTDIFTDDICIVFRKFLSIAAFTFSPILLGLRENEIQSYVILLQEKSFRSKNANNPQEKIMELFTSPMTFEDLNAKIIINKYQSTMEEKNPSENLANMLVYTNERELMHLKTKNGIRAFPLFARNWTVDDIELFVKNIILSTPQIRTYTFLSPFLSGISYAHDFVPMYLQHSPDLLAIKFFGIGNSFETDIALEAEQLEIMNSISSVAKHVNPSNINKISTDKIELWIALLIKYLCHKDPTIIKFALKATLESINRFNPYSDILNFFVFNLLLIKRDIVVTDEDKLNIMLNIYCLYLRQPEIKLPKFIDKKFESQIADKALYKKVVANITLNFHYLQANSVLFYVIEPLGARLPSESSDAYVFYPSAFVPLLLLDVFGDNNAQIGILQSGLGSLRNGICYSMTNEQNVHEIATLAIHHEMMTKKVPNFFRTMTKVLSVLSANSLNDESACFIARTVCSMARSPSDWYYIASKFRDAAEKKKSRPPPLDTVAFLPSMPPPKLDSVASCFFGSDCVFCIEGNDEKFSAHCRTRGSFASFSVSPVARANNSQCEVMYPETEDDGQMRIDYGFGSFLNKFSSNKYTPKTEPQKEHPKIEIPAPSIAKPKWSKLGASQPSGCMRGMIFSRLGSTFVQSLGIWTNDLLSPNLTKLTQRKIVSAVAVPVRECIKIGILYVKSGQVTQSEILSNTHDVVSPAFDSFIRAIGSVVDPQNHRWYTGKVDGSKFVYYSDARYEVVFHVATLLQHSESNSQQILKKKHIGNDNVNIVWCENEGGFDPAAVTSQVIDTFIVISPHSNHTYRVTRWRKDGKHVGPLSADCIVPDISLPTLVRETAISCDRLSRVTLEKSSVAVFTEMVQSLVASL